MLLTRNDRSAPALDIPRAPEAVVAAVTAAAEAAAEEAAVRSLTSVAPSDGTAEYPVLRL
jgi:hypothetical protein